MRILLWICLLFAFVSSTFGNESKDTAIAVIVKQFEAFNRHDPEALANGVAEDFVWYTVTSDSTTVESQGREKLREGMKSYFKSFPDVSSKVESLASDGQFVSLRETVSWTSKKGRIQQSSIAVYEVSDGVIARVWYYQAKR